MEKACGAVDRQHIIARITSALIAGYAPQRIILFGSFAYGEPDEESDIDLLVIKDTPERFLDRLFKVRSLLFDLHLRVGLDPIVLTPAELADRLRIGDQFIRQAWERGKPLYVSG